MVSRENRVLLASLGLVALATVAVGLAPIDSGSSVLVLLVVAGLGVLAPQLYLAATDDDVPARTRVRVGVLLSALYAMALYGTAPPDEQVVVAGAAGALVVALVGYEFVAGYREPTA